MTPHTANTPPLSPAVAHAPAAVRRLLALAQELPLVAILRGLAPDEAQAVGAALYASGMRTLEVPLNRPGALECIAHLARSLPDDALVGGGTVMSPQDVDAVHAAGGRLIVSPHCDVRVIERALALDMLCAPGVVTPTEAFTALAAGAHALKIFPADALGHAGLKGLKSVLPAGTEIWPVGGVGTEQVAGWRQAGATGLGIGGQLYTPGRSAQAVGALAAQFIAAWNAAAAATA